MIARWCGVWRAGFASPGSPRVVDEESSTPGGDWQRELSARLLDSRACAVFVGAHDIHGWADLEMKVALNRGTSDHDYRVFAVLLPDVGPVFDPSRLPPFLATKQWVDLREGPESAAADTEPDQRDSRCRRAGTGHGRETTGECPYRGLEVFKEEHARYFFGRAAQVQRLLEELRPSRFLAVIGQSGVGKSSLVRAGLLPQLRSGALPGQRELAFRRHPTRRAPDDVPGDRDRRAAAGTACTTPWIGSATDERTLHLAAALAVADEPAGTKLLVLVDQFEEVFTLCTRSGRAVGVRAQPDLRRDDPARPHGRRGHDARRLLPPIAQFPEFAQLVQSHHDARGPMNDARCARSSRSPRTRRACRSSRA